MASVTRPFRMNCNRLRLTADGKLRYCLFAIDPKSGSWNSVDGAKSLKEIRMSTASQFTILVITDSLATVCGLKP